MFSMTVALKWYLKNMQLEFSYLKHISGSIIRIYGWDIVDILNDYNMK
jgi:hypothetical protein